MTITSPPPGVRRLVGTALLAVLVAPGAAWAVIRLFGLERGWMVQLVAFTPYVAAVVWAPVLVALVCRKWWLAAIAAVAAVALAACVLPRAVRDRDAGPSHGFPLTAMTINMYVGQADPDAIVRLVR